MMMNPLLATNLLVVGTNAVLSFVLSQVTDFAHKANLPDQTNSIAQVKEFIPLHNKLGGWVTFNSGNTYYFDFGYVVSFESSHAFYGLQDPSLIPKFYGSLNMTTNEAIELARKTIRELGYSEEMLYADLRPEVETPAPMGTNIIPHFLITWPAANRPVTESASFEINGSARRIESIWFLNWNLYRDVPDFPGLEPAKKTPPAQLAAEESAAFLKTALPKIVGFIKLLNLSSIKPTGTNEVDTLIFYENTYSKLGTIKLRDGFSFLVLSNQVLGFTAPDVFFAGDHEVRVKDFTGNRIITEAQAIALARSTIRELGLPERWVAASPRIDQPFGAAKELVPRCALYWAPYTNGTPSIRVEVDQNMNTIKSLTIW